VITLRQPSKTISFAAFGVVVLVVLAIYLPTLQTIPIGSDHFLMVDVGETQIVLNLWGSLHATGYPLYVMLGNVLVTAMKALGIDATTAPAVVSLLWGIGALAAVYALALHLSGRVLLSALMVGLFGLTRLVWIHQVIAEIYTFGLLLLVLMLVVALWNNNPIQLALRGSVGDYRRIYWLALLGGIGVSHHRALMFVAPALLYAVWPQLTAAFKRRELPKVIVISLLLGLVGFLPYLYLPVREWTGAPWVYGEPGTLSGFWDQFIGREADHYMGLPASGADFASGLALVNNVLIDDLMLPGIVVGLAGLLLALRYPQRRRVAITLLLNAGVSYAFHVLVYHDVLAQLVLQITTSLVFGWLFMFDIFLAVPKRRLRMVTQAALIPVAALLAVTLWVQNYPWVNNLTHNQTGLQTIALLEEAPEGSTVMFDWGPRYVSAAYERDVLGGLQHIQLVDHKSNLRQAADNDGPLITPEYTLFRRPVSWWEEQLGQPVYLRAAAPYLVEIGTEPEIGESTDENGITQETNLRCTPDSIILVTAWFTPDLPQQDMSVFVHLLDEGGNVIAQADQFAPVYGWRPLTTWLAGEIVRDVYALPRIEGAASVAYGLYRQLPSGEFQNEYEYSIPVECDAS